MTEKKLDWNKPIEAVYSADASSPFEAKLLTDTCRLDTGMTCRIVLVEHERESRVHRYEHSGAPYYPHSPRLRNRKTKHEAWQNLYRSYSVIMSGTQLYKSEELARKEASDSPSYVATVKVEWEE
jgi:hypothetical protein